MPDIIDPIPTPASPAPDILRCASMELVVTDLAKSREFYVDILGLHVTEEDDEVVYLRSFEEFIHHNLVLRQGPVAAVAAFSYRVRSPQDIDLAEAYFQDMGCRTERRKDGFVKGVGDTVRVEDPLGFPYEFFYETDHSPGSGRCAASTGRSSRRASPAVCWGIRRWASPGWPTSWPSTATPSRPGRRCWPARSPVPCG